MNAPRPFNECRECGELNRRTAKRCAMCGARIDPAVVVADEPPREEDTVTAIVLMVAVGIVWLGVFLAAPGVGILLAILAAVPFLRTAAVLSRRSDAGISTSLLAKVVLFLGSLGTTLVVLTVVLVTAVGTFCAVCLAGAVGTGGRGPMTGLIVTSVLIALGVVGVVGFALSKWIRARWKRDVGDRVPPRR